MRKRLKELEELSQCTFHPELTSGSGSAHHSAMRADARRTKASDDWERGALRSTVVLPLSATTPGKPPLCCELSDQCRKMHEVKRDFVHDAGNDSLLELASLEIDTLENFGENIAVNPNAS
jgi:hypothetical protein